jgi:hypothetical protein
VVYAQRTPLGSGIRIRSSVRVTQRMQQQTVGHAMSLPALPLTLALLGWSRGDLDEIAFVREPGGAPLWRAGTGIRRCCDTQHIGWATVLNLLKGFRHLLGPPDGKAPAAPPCGPQDQAAARQSAAKLLSSRPTPPPPANAHVNLNAPPPVRGASAHAPPSPPRKHITLHII